MSSVGSRLRFVARAGICDGSDWDCDWDCDGDGEPGDGCWWSAAGPRLGPWAWALPLPWAWPWPWPLTGAIAPAGEAILAANSIATRCVAIARAVVGRAEWLQRIPGGRGGWLRRRGWWFVATCPSRWLRAAWCSVLAQGRGRKCGTFALSGPGAKRQTELASALVCSGMTTRQTLTRNITLRNDLNVGRLCS